MGEKSIFFKYSLQDAESDGVLFKLFIINSQWEQGLFSHITTNLLSYGYEANGIINMPNLIDLLNQSLKIVRSKTNNFENYDSFPFGKIEFPKGKLKEIFICENELEKFTIMLPEDY